MSVGEDQAGVAVKDEPELPADAADELEPETEDVYHALDDPAAEEEEEEAEGLEISTDSLQLFLKDVGKVDLLTAAQEVELAKRIERGDHRAKQEMVEANLRLVVSIATRSLSAPTPSLVRGPSATVLRNWASAESRWPVHASRSPR